MFERFTTDARQVVQVAQAEARSLNHGWVGTEHLLLGLLRQPTPAATALAAVGISHQAVMAQLEAMVASAGTSAGTSAGNDAELLNLLGIDLEEVRRRIDEAFGAGALDRVRTMPPRRRRRSPMVTLGASIQQVRRVVLHDLAAS